MQDLAKGINSSNFLTTPSHSFLLTIYNEVTLVCPGPKNDSGAGGGKAETKMIIT